MHISSSWISDSVPGLEKQQIYLAIELNRDAMFTLTSIVGSE